MGLMSYAKSFPGWQNFGALVAHLEFVKDHHRRIQRVAAESDSGVWLILPLLARYFVRPEVRPFAHHDKGKALAWLAVQLQKIGAN